MNSTQLSLDIESPKHYNRGLFSDYYLNELVFSDPGWFEMENEARDVRNHLRELRERINPEALDEAQLEELWIKPVLHALGHLFRVQVKIRYQEKGYRKPDYVLAHSEEAASELTSDIYTPAELASRAFAVCDAKRWGVNLDQSPGRGERNPSQQIDEYLRYSELPWGILTDGQYWRLYERESSKNNVYYAVDLFDLLTRDARDFMYFYVFFRREAFITDWLQRTLQGSTEFAQQISEQLEDQVYEALELIAQGFLDYRRNNLEPTPEVLRTIYEQSLVFLYRLLFVLYAESRSILPMDASQAYREKQSLSSIKRQVLKKQEQGALDPDHSVYYAHLKDLFFAIDRGNPRFSVPAYNGKLFSEQSYPFLANNSVGDAYLAPAIDKMARTSVQNGNGNGNGKRPQIAFIDYRDLDVRHLGSIYEKLLEYHLDRADEPLTLKSGKYVVAQPGDVVAIEPGKVYLRTGNFERKVTGSYYTPDYIVRFIVERTLEPLLTEITEQYAIRDEEGHWVVQDPEGVRRAILALNILDPATGSGHFLVEVMSYIAEWLRSLAILSPGELTEGEDELAFWKRHVVNACIYGIDVNPLAVELAKLSLWLATLAEGKPLSFLNHHVKRGNTLVGATINEIASEIIDPAQERRARARQAEASTAGQGILWDSESFSPAITSAVQRMADIEGTMGRTLESVKQQEEQYDDLSEAMEPWKVLADVWLARYFGLQVDQKTWDAIRSALLDGLNIPKDQEAIVTQANQLAEAYGFLHLELEWPEVFFNPDGTLKDNPGFDAVVGNPPYVRQQSISVLKPYLSLKYDIYHNNADLFLYFYEMGLSWLRRNQRLGYVTSGTFMNSNSAAPFRKFIHNNAGLETVANFGENQPFRGAEMVYPTIMIMRRGHPSMRFRSLFVEDVIQANQLEHVLELGDWVESLSELTSLDEWRFQPVELTQLFKKIAGTYSILNDVVSGQMYYGVLTGFNEAFVIDGTRREALIKEHASSLEIIRPMIRGQDLRPWYQINSGEYLILARQGIDIDRYPAIKRYLEQFQERLEPQPSDWNSAANGRWPGRTGGNYRWCEWHDTVAYYEVFDKPKIFWPEIAKLPRFSVDEEANYANNKCSIIISDPYPLYSLLGLLQSRVIWFFLSQIATPLRLRAGLWQYQLFHQFVERIPIPNLKTEMSSNLGDLASQITAIASQRYSLHESMRDDIQGLGRGVTLNRRLERWWEIEDAAVFQREVQRVGMHIPVKQLAEWRDHLTDQQAEHNRLSEQISGLEQSLNDIVFQAFGLNSDEIKLIEQATKYPYGAA
jgi:type I restriction-modification system DNA methylase subunit